MRGSYRWHVHSRNRNWRKSEFLSKIKKRGILHFWGCQPKWGLWLTYVIHVNHERGQRLACGWGGIHIGTPFSKRLIFHDTVTQQTRQESGRGCYPSEMDPKYFLSGIFETTRSEAESIHSIQIPPPITGFVECELPPTKHWLLWMRTPCIPLVLLPPPRPNSEM